MEVVTISSSKLKELSKIELVIAFVKCFDGGVDCDHCHGCPLEGETSCAYNLKMEIVNRLMGGD